MSDGAKRIVVVTRDHSLVVGLAFGERPWQVTSHQDLDPDLADDDLDVLVVDLAADVDASVLAGLADDLPTLVIGGDSPDVPPGMARLRRPFSLDQLAERIDELAAGSGSDGSRGEAPGSSSRRWARPDPPVITRVHDLALAADRRPVVEVSSDPPSTAGTAIAEPGDAGDAVAADEGAAPAGEAGTAGDVVTTDDDAGTPGEVAAADEAAPTDEAPPADDGAPAEDPPDDAVHVIDLAAAVPEPLVPPPPSSRGRHGTDAPPGPTGDTPSLELDGQGTGRGMVVTAKPVIALPDPIGDAADGDDAATSPAPSFATASSGLRQALRPSSWFTKRVAQVPAGAVNELDARIARALVGLSELEALLTDIPLLRSIPALSAAIVHEVKVAFDADTAALWERGDDGWRVVAGLGLTPYETRTPVPFDHPLMTEVDDTGGALLIDPIDHAGAAVAGVGGAHVRSFMAASLAWRTRRCGIVTVGRDAPSFVDDDVDRLVRLASEAAPGLAVAQHLFELYTTEHEVAVAEGRAEPEADDAHPASTPPESGGSD